MVGLGAGPRDALMYVPSKLPDGPIPLVVMFHGAGGEPARTLPMLQGEADRRKFLVLAPKSRHATWDVISGELFSRVLAFSPGFVVPATRHGRPSVFISHGRADTVLPIDRCSRRIVATLKSEGYDVDYREFAGGHEVPPELVTEAIEALTS